MVILSERPRYAIESATASTDELRYRGYCVIENAISRDEVNALASDLAPDFERTARSVGAFYGEGTKRFHSLLRRSQHAARFVQHPSILAIVDSVLRPYCEQVQLNLTQAIEILPGSEEQPPHRDQDMWSGPKGDIEYLVNVMWPFTPYTAENGATRIWPGSHRRLDQIVMDPDDAVAAVMDPGSALLFLGSTLHCGGANLSSRSRRGMIVSYSLGWLKPYELPWLAYPPEIARHFSAELAALAGYRAHRPNLGTFEGRCPSVLLGEDRSDTIGAIDALRPEQEALIAAYRAGALVANTVGEATESHAQKSA